MGIGELHSKVLVEYKADVSDMKAKLKGLQGDEKSLGEARVKAAEASNKAIEGQIRNIGRISTGLQIAKSAGLDLAGSIQKLTGIPIGGTGSALGFMFGGPWGAAIGTLGEMLGGMLADAFNGSQRDAIKTADTYMALVASMKAENAELEEAADAYRKVAEARRDADPSIGGMQRALDENTGKWQKARDAIVSYSMALSDVQNDRRAGSPSAAQTPFGSYAATFISRQEIELKRSLRDAKTMAEGTTSSFGSVAAEAKIKADRLKDSLADVRAAHESGELKGKAHGDALRALGVDVDSTADKAKRLAEELRKISNSYAKKVTDELLEREGEGLGVAGVLDRDAREGAAARNPDDLQIQGRSMEDFLAKTKEDLAESEFNRAGTSGPSVLERMFGKREEIDAYRETWSGLMGVVSAGYSAMVDGSMSFGQAAKRAAGDAIKALGLKMLIEGAEQTATGIKMAAGIYTAPLAPGHFAAAAKYFAGAAIAGVAANQLGSGGGGMPSAGGGSGGGYRPSAPSGYSPSAPGERSAPVIVVGDPFAYDSPRNQVKNAKRLVTMAAGTSSVVYG